MLNVLHILQYICACPPTGIFVSSNQPSSCDAIAVVIFLERKTSKTSNIRSVRTASYVDGDDDGTANE